MTNPSQPPSHTLPPHSPDDRCAYFGECGGCSSQDLPYADQLAQKAAVLQELLDGHWHDPIEVLPSPVIWNYRNKVDLNFARKRYDEPPPKGFERETLLGFNRKGKWYWPLDIEECRIAPTFVEEVCAAVRDWYLENDIRAYDERCEGGILRALLLREGRRTGERLVTVCTSAGDFDPIPFLKALESVLPIHSISRGIMHGRSQGSFAEEVHFLAGAEHINEELHVTEGGETRELRFVISPMSFFQTNTLATEVLYAHVRAWVRQQAPTILYDLYGGSGGIAIACADLAGHIRSVDNVPSASADGLKNVSLNGVENVFFTTEDMKHYLKFIADNGAMESNSATIVDPSRAGLNPKVLRRLIAAAPPSLLYVSCNPKIFAQELPELLKHYTLDSVKAIDLFPHTPHVELLAAFTRRR